MKNSKMMLSAAFFLTAIVFPLATIAAPAREAEALFRDAEGKEWILSELSTAASAGSAGKTTFMDRQKLALNNMAGFYTISFREGRLSGLGAPNRYNGPYSTGANRLISIGNIASTMMAAFMEPEELKENDYFNYLSGAKRWDLLDGKLELYCLSRGGDEAILTFTLR